MKEMDWHQLYRRQSNKRMLGLLVTMTNCVLGIHANLHVIACICHCSMWKTFAAEKLPD